MAAVQQLLASYGAAAAATNTKSLLHFNGADGSTSIADDTGKSWTAQGNAQIDTAQSQFGGASLLLDGTADYATTAYSSDFSILGNFTIEAFIRRTATGRDAILSCYSSGASGFLFDIGASDELRLIMGTGSFITCSSGATTVPTGSWVHVAGVRDGSTLRVFIGGTQAGTLAVTGTPANYEPGTITIGRDNLDTSRDFGGHIDEFRFSNVARYTASFTPPAAPFTLD